MSAAFVSFHDGGLLTVDAIIAQRAEFRADGRALEAVGPYARGKARTIQPFGCSFFLRFTARRMGELPTHVAFEVHARHVRVYRILLIDPLIGAAVVKTPRELTETNPLTLEKPTLKRIGAGKTERVSRA